MWEGRRGSWERGRDELKGKRVSDMIRKGGDE